MLELLASSLLVTVRHGSVVDFLDVWESVDNEGAEEDSVADFIALNRKTHQTGEGFEFGYLDEAVDVIVLEEQTLQLLKALQLRDVTWPDYVVESHVLERYLLHCLLEVQIVQHLKSVSIDEKFVVTFDLCVTTLDEALRSRLFAPLIAVKTQSLDSLHFVLPFLADDLEESLGADVFLLVAGLGVWDRWNDNTSDLCRLSCCGYRIHVGIII